MRPMEKECTPRMANFVPGRKQSVILIGKWRDPAKILTQGIKINFKGKPVEYRAEVVLEPDQKQSAVMWTDGATFRQIISKSRADAHGTREAIRLLSKRCVGISRRPYKTGLHARLTLLLTKPRFVSILIAKFVLGVKGKCPCRAGKALISAPCGDSATPYTNKKSLMGHHHPQKMLKMKGDPEMCMKTKDRLTKCPTKCRAFVPG